MPYFLTTSIDNKKLKVNAKAGDEVKIVSDHGNVIIVEDKKGNRFSVLKNEIKEK